MLVGWHWRGYRSRLEPCCQRLMLLDNKQRGVPPTGVKQKCWWWWWRQWLIVWYGLWFVLCFEYLVLMQQMNIIISVSFQHCQFLQSVLLSCTNTYFGIEDMEDLVEFTCHMLPLQNLVALVLDYEWDVWLDWDVIWHFNRVWTALNVGFECLGGLSSSSSTFCRHCLSWIWD